MTHKATNAKTLATAPDGLHEAQFFCLEGANACHVHLVNHAKMSPYLSRILRTTAIHFRLEPDVLFKQLYPFPRVDTLPVSGS